MDAGDKYVVRSCRLLHPTAWDERLARHFAADCAAYAAAARNAEREWQAERFLYYLKGGQPPCSD